MDASSEAATAASTHVSVTGAELAGYTKLLKFVTGILDGIKRENVVWVLVASEFAGDVGALAAAAEGGVAKGQSVCYAHF